MKRNGKFNCRRCGHCCLTLIDAYRGCVSDADLNLWRQEARTEILDRIESVVIGKGNVIHFAWVDPVTRDDVDRCPWLAELPDGTGYYCRIEEVKPEHCRNYPEDRKHAEATGCPGYNSGRT